MLGDLRRKIRPSKGSGSSTTGPGDSLVAEQHHLQGSLPVLSSHGRSARFLFRYHRRVGLRGDLSPWVVQRLTMHRVQMEDKVQDWWLVFVPMAAAALGFLVRRAIERRRQSEGLKRKLQALALHQGMKAQGLSFSDLAEIESKAANQ